MNSANDVQLAITKNRMIDTSDKLTQLDKSRIPAHVAIIMDGNGRWARMRSQNRSVGHEEGVNSVNRITRFASDLGVDYLTLYAFSTENWNRPEPEVTALMHLIGWTIKNETPDLVKNNVKINLLGDISRLPNEVRANLMEGCEATAHCSGLNLQICLSYSARWEITEAMKTLAKDIVEKGLKTDEITESLISDTLSTRNIPDPDLLIRTGGEQRISNFLLWQIAYSELYFTPILWPEFNEEAFLDALIDYQGRERRFGKTSDQISEDNTKDDSND